MIDEPHAILRRDRMALDWLNFLLADVEAGLGPFLAVYLLSGEHWDPASIGMVLTIAGLATVLARAPAGALVDYLRCKRSLIALAALIVAIAAASMALVPRFWPVVFAQFASGVAAAIFPVTIAAISLGICGRANLTRRIGRNEAFNHAGNIVAAALAGLAGHFVDARAPLWIIAALALLSMANVFAINSRSIDHQMARGADNGPGRRSSLGGWQILLANRPLFLFTLSVTLFHFANAAMLPLIGEKLSEMHQNASSLFMASCIIVAQIVMVPMALLAGRKADLWGRKPLFLLGFLALPVRGLLYTLVHDPRALIAVQLLDGIGAGIFGVLFFVVVADLTKGSGHYNLAVGVAGACWGLGAALSNAVSGGIVDLFGYSAAFLFLSACAVLAALVFVLGVPETRSNSVPDRTSPKALPTLSPTDK